MKKTTWIISEHAPGMLSQATGLAEALGLEYQHQPINLTMPWKHLPPSWVPIKPWTITPPNRVDEEPSLIISCGRKSVIPALVLKRIVGSCQNIHILNPYLQTNLFDYVIAPKHDHIPGDNVIHVLGSVHNLNSQKINQHKHHLQPQRKHQSRVITILLGGPNRCYQMSIAIIKALLDKIAAVFDENDYQQMIIPSRRTPQCIIDYLHQNKRDSQFIGSQSSRIDYLSALALADKIVVTSDSICMTSEAAATGKPVFIAGLPITKLNKRFEEFHDTMAARGITRYLKHGDHDWHYQPLNEISQVVTTLKKGLTL
ncbi:MAG: hypothetical protein CMF46_05495 [Legionellales bacterium]|nr:hypothetical protein [Legionellales bacterium]|tara:strand:+ start:447 stop:1388 length:942 start_codon:yes stop_codon:yes gene_type:complete